jgi:hypothetical protein
MRVFGLLRARDVRSRAGPVLDVAVPPGTTLISEGELIGTFFVIRAGTATIWRGTSALGSLGPGDCFGEVEPNAPALQQFTVIASSELRFLTFSSLGIERLCSEIPGARERILGYLPSGRTTGALAQGGGVEDRDGAVVGGDPTELAHQAKCAGDRLARGARPARKLILRQR